MRDFQSHHESDEGILVIEDDTFARGAEFKLLFIDFGEVLVDFSNLTLFNVVYRGSQRMFRNANGEWSDVDPRDKQPSKLYMTRGFHDDSSRAADKKAKTLLFKLMNDHDQSFTKRLHAAGLRNLNNEIYRLDEEIEKREKELKELHSKRQIFINQEVAAQAGDR